MNLINELKIKAQRLQKAYAFGQSSQQTTLTKQLAKQHKTDLILRDAQRFVAQFCGFNDWQHALDIDSGHDSQLGSLFYQHQCSAIVSPWFSDHTSALSELSTGFVLLPFKQQWVLANEAYLNCLGLSIYDPIWSQHALDWQSLPSTIKQQIIVKRVQAIRID